jgi:5'-deoxynucleotidase YfbR-like HD superfamily hydrolase
MEKGNLDKLFDEEAVKEFINLLLSDDEELQKELKYRIEELAKQRRAAVCKCIGLGACFW